MLRTVERREQIRELYLLDRRALLAYADHGPRPVAGVELDPDGHALAHEARGLAEDHHLGGEAQYAVLELVRLRGDNLHVRAQLSKDLGYALPVRTRLVREQDEHPAGPVLYRSGAQHGGPPSGVPAPRTCRLPTPRGLTYLDDAVAGREDEGLQPRVDPELVEDVHHVGALGLDGDAQPLGDLTALQPFGEGLERLLLPGGEPLHRPPRRELFLALTVDEAQHLDDVARREQRLPGLKPPHRVDYLVDGGGLVQHAGGADLDRAREAARLQARAQDQRDRSRREVLEQVEPVAVGEGQVDYGDLHLIEQPAVQRPCLGHGAHLRDDVEPWLSLEHEREGLAERDVVLHE